MEKNKTLFVVSDIHGHYSLMKKALDDAGFEENNEDHIFICCGDLFDRGHENRRVYDFVRRLEHKVLIRGNHDDSLVEILTDKKANIYDLYNGMDITLEEFFGADSIGSYGELTLPKYGKMAGKLCSLIDGMVDYYETEHYVFVHGWIPTDPYEKPPRLVKDWRNADRRAWHSARFSEWIALYGTSAMLPRKTIVCGHRPTRLGYRVDESRAPTDSSIFFGEGMIAIDAGTVRSGRVNILVLNDRCLEE